MTNQLIEEKVKEFRKRFFIAGRNAIGQEVPLLFPSKIEIEDFLKQSLLQVQQEERKRCQNKYELRGAGKILDILWDSSYYSMGKEASKRIEKEMIYYFGKNWAIDMYKFIEDKPSCRPEPIKRLKEIEKIIKKDK
jgi:ornithine carbamoyltransferase